MRCILCGKVYKNDVTEVHILNHHYIMVETYNRKKRNFTDAEWEFYWTHPKLRRKFPVPLAKKAQNGRQLTFREWVRLPKVRNRHPQLDQN